ncbi:B domain-containing protein [Staphylococcus agnetis]|uniref:B domain-containing protein n=1 Tax=Staphylococcus agnetis TaxID=985762 RepID=UPI0021D022C0|nr:B domain-containing protein [Staphylococcus agnetis]UXU55057.1 B domain-containing protein [Staphylococcus agnetis]
MRKQNISRLLVGAATITLATMVANGEASASEQTKQQNAQHQTQHQQPQYQQSQHQAQHQQPQYQAQLQQTQHQTHQDPEWDYQAKERYKQQQEEQHAVQSAYHHLLNLKGLSEKQRGEFLKQLHENPTKETAQNVFSESIKDVNNPERRVAQRKAYINLLENNDLTLEDRERLIKEVKKNADHAQQIWIESHRLSNANSKNRISEHELNRLIKPTQEDYDRRDKFIESEKVKQLQSSNKGNTASVDELKDIILENKYDKVIEDVQKLEKLQGSNKDNTATEEQFNKFIAQDNQHFQQSPGIPDELFNKLRLPKQPAPQNNNIDFLTNRNNDNTVTSENIDNIFKPIAVNKKNTSKNQYQEAIVYPLFDDSYEETIKRLTSNKGKSKQEFQSETTYPLYENAPMESDKELLERLTSSNDDNTLNENNIDDLFPPMAVKRNQSKVKPEEGTAYPLINDSLDETIKHLPADKEMIKKHLEDKKLHERLISSNNDNTVNKHNIDKVFPPIALKPNKAKDTREEGTIYPLFNDSYKETIEKLPKHKEYLKKHFGNKANHSSKRVTKTYKYKKTQKYVIKHNAYAKRHKHKFPNIELPRKQVLKDLQDLQRQNKLTINDLERIMDYFPPIPVGHHQAQSYKNLFPNFELTKDQILKDLQELKKQNRVSTQDLEKIMSYFPATPVEQKKANVVKDTLKNSSVASKVTETKKFPTEDIVREKATNKVEKKSTLVDYYKSFKYYVSTYYKHKTIIDKSTLALLGGGSKTHIKPLDIRPGDNPAYNALKHARNYITEGINTGKVLYHLSKNPSTVKTLISAADTLSSFSNSISNFASSILK